MTRVYRNVDEFIANLSEAKPMIELVRQKAQQEGNREMLKQSEKLLLLFANDAAILRIVAQKIQGPDGTVRFDFTGDAARFLQSLQRT